MGVFSRLFLNTMRFKLVTPKSKSGFMKTKLCRSYLRAARSVLPARPTG